VPFALGLAALLHDVGKPATQGQGKGKLTFHHHEHVGREISEEVCRRLKLSNDQTGRICWLVEHHMYLGEAKQLRWAKLKRMLVEPGIAQLLALHWADALASTADTGSIQYCLEVLRTMPEDELNPPPLLTGHDLIRHGVQRGPIYTQLLETVRDAQLENRIRSKRDALTLVDQMLKERRGGDRMPGD
jgi:poly(A) polymerase